MSPVAKARPIRTAARFPEIDGAVIDMHGRSGGSRAVVNRAARPVGRSVVRDDDLHRDALAEVDRGHALEDFVNSLLFVVNGNDDG